MEKCVLCDFVKYAGGGKTVQCGKTGIDTIVKCSLKQEDGVHKFCEGKTVLEVHPVCRRNYTRRPKAPAKAPAPAKICRSFSGSSFDFKQQCLFCDKCVDPQHPNRNPFCQVGTIEVIHNIRKRAEDRNDEWGNSVSLKLSTVSDLVAAEGRYHKECYNYFQRDGSTIPGCKTAQGRKPDEKKQEAFESLCRELEKSEDCQYTLSHLKTKLHEYGDANTYSDIHLKNKLRNKYGDGITFSDLPGRRCVMCFTGVADKILSDKWYSDRKADAKSEELRVIITAAQLLRQKVKSLAYDMAVYPPAHEIATGGENLVPDELRVFLEELLQVKKNPNDAKQRRAVALGQNIVSAIRPRSFLSPLHIGLGVSLHRMFGSRLLLDILHNIGACISYSEAMLFEESVATYAQATIDSYAYVQPVFDNADHNVSTLDGKGTLHIMGGILTVTPKNALHADVCVPRKKSANADEVKQASGFLPVKPYFRPDFNGYSKLIATDVTEVQLNCDGEESARILDALWASGLWSGASPHPGWSGYMEAAHRNSSFEVSAVVPLPFINLTPTNPSTIFTALLHAAEYCKKQNQKFIFVTFDQQLYCKAVEMVLAAAEESPLRCIIVRLGGFHFLKSFLGAIGTIMAGSGLEECLAVVYARNTVDHMMTGNAYSRAIRGHSLVQLSLFTLLFESLSDSNLQMSLRQLSNDLQNGLITPEEAVQSPDIAKGLKAVQNLLKEASKTSRTCKLWAQYIEMVSLIRMFLRAERSGDWRLHLLTVQKMLAHFHAAGHLNYAKSGQVYLQQMIELENKLPLDEFEKFVNAGYFTIRRTSKFWSGIQTDMTIEQVLMRSIKTSGGLTRGRGQTDATIAKWIHCAPACALIIEALRNFSGVAETFNDEHVELRESRQRRDHAAAEMILAWLRQHDPLNRKTTALVSVATGRIANERANCDNAFEVGIQAMKKMIGKPFSEVRLHRKDSVVSLASSFKGIVVRGKLINVNPDQLFHRMLLTKKSDEELAEFLTFELQEPPPALFDDLSMREGTKSKLMSVFPGTDMPQETIVTCTRYVMDGGFLLRQGPQWLRTDTYGEICDKYIEYLNHKCKASVTVVFDGYETASTKDPAHARRAQKGSNIDVIVDEHRDATIAQDVFLSNGHNKTSLIRLLTKKMTDVGITVVQAPADADRTIVTTAIACAQRGEETVIIGRDTDLAVLLIALTPAHLDVKFLVPGVQGKPSKGYSSKTCQDALGGMTKHILFCHAATGCDTTSATFKLGKVKPFKNLEKNKELQRVVEIFNLSDADPDDLAQAGETFLAAQYPGREDNLNAKRYQLYKKINKNLPADKKFNLAQLPPTSEAARHHFLRVYLQVQEWLGSMLNPTDWGWTLEGGRFSPVTNTRPPAPATLLEMISCECVSGCDSGNCTCSRNRIDCSNMCGFCAGHGCNNRHAPEEDDPDDDLLPILSRVPEGDGLEGMAPMDNDDVGEPPAKRRSVKRP